MDRGKYSRVGRRVSLAFFAGLRYALTVLAGIHHVCSRIYIALIFTGVNFVKKRFLGREICLFWWSDTFSCRPRGHLASGPRHRTTSTHPQAQATIRDTCFCLRLSLPVQLVLRGALATNPSLTESSFPESLLLFIPSLLPPLPTRTIPSENRIVLD